MDGPGRRPGTYFQGWTPSMHLFCLQSPDAVHAASMHFLSIIQKSIECYQKQRDAERERERDTQRVRHTESERDMPCLTVGMESGVLTEGDSACRLMLYGRPTA